jgi:hypothetical protein
MVGYLMHKDDVFAKLDIDDYGFKVIEFYTNRFPCESEPVLHKWFSARQTPYSAGNLADAYKFIGVDTFKDFMTLTAFTSINDCFWVKTNTKQTWSNTNLYTNHFTKCLEDILMGRFNINGGKTQNSIYNPCFTNGGSFPKIFKHYNGDIYCIKGSRKQKIKELDNWFIYSELLVCQIYKYLKLTHYVDYELSTYKGELVCSSKIFTNESIEYFPAVYKLNGYPNYETIKKLFGNFELFYIMLLIDCVTFNKDRHTGNYGFLIDSYSGKVIGMNQLYDNNYALFPDLSIKGVTKDNFHILNETVVSRLDDEPFDSLARKILADYPKGKYLLSSLLNFKFTCVDKAQPWRINRLNAILHTQCKHILEGV